MTDSYTHPTQPAQKAGESVHELAKGLAIDAGIQTPDGYLSDAKYVLLPLAEKLTGYTVKAMEQKIDSGVWLEGEVWMRSPDGRRHIIMEGYRSR